LGIDREVTQMEVLRFKTEEVFKDLVNLALNTSSLQLRQNKIGNHYRNKREENTQKNLRPVLYFPKALDIKVKDVDTEKNNNADHGCADSVKAATIPL
jgi:hypothetical protein